MSLDVFYIKLILGVGFVLMVVIVIVLSGKRETYHFTTMDSGRTTDIHPVIGDERPKTEVVSTPDEAAEKVKRVGVVILTTDYTTSNPGGFGAD